jgi:hypothetical protein
MLLVHHRIFGIQILFNIAVRFNFRMKIGIKRVFSLFTLLLFLGPLLGNEIHSLSHWDDEHCTQGGLHFHAEEHHCHLCDFVLPFSLAPVQSYDESAVNISYTNILFSGYSSSALSGIDFNFSLRGPPLV